MYTSGRTVKSKASKPTELTVAKATAQVRRLVAKHLPDVLVTVDSARSYDLEADQELIVTTVTFPEAADVLAFWRSIEALDPDSREWGTARITITRTVR